MLQGQHLLTPTTQAQGSRAELEGRQGGGLARWLYTRGLGWALPLQKENAPPTPCTPGNGARRPSSDTALPNASLSRPSGTWERSGGTDPSGILRHGRAAGGEAECPGSREQP